MCQSGKECPALPGASTARSAAAAPSGGASAASAATPGAPLGAGAPWPPAGAQGTSQWQLSTPFHLMQVAFTYSRMQLDVAALLAEALSPAEPRGTVEHRMQLHAVVKAVASNAS